MNFDPTNTKARPMKSLKAPTNFLYPCNILRSTALQASTPVKTKTDSSGVLRVTSKTRLEDEWVASLAFSLQSAIILKD